MLIDVAIVNHQLAYVQAARAAPPLRLACHANARVGSLARNAIPQTYFAGGVHGDAAHPAVVAIG